MFVVLCCTSELRRTSHAGAKCSLECLWLIIRSMSGKHSLPLLCRRAAVRIAKTKCSLEQRITCEQTHAYDVIPSFQQTAEMMSIGNRIQQQTKNGGHHRTQRPEVNATLQHETQTNMLCDSSVTRSERCVATALQLVKPLRFRLKRRRLMRVMKKDLKE